MDEMRDANLQRITRTAKNPVGLRRAIVVPLSGQGRPARNTTLTQVSDAYLRDAIREFSEKGLDPQARAVAGATVVAQKRRASGRRREAVR